jgi:serine phosphatase RsbU (regulator of sigma subunit)
MRRRITPRLGGNLSTDRAEEVLGTLLEASHTLPPEDLADVVAVLAGRLGAQKSVIYLIDFEQRILVPLSGRKASTAPMLEVDATLAGRVFRTQRMHEAEADADVDGIRLWIPIVDGSDRLGVFGVDVDEVDAECERRFHHLASLLGELLVSRGQYGDHINNTRRLKPMDLAAELRWSMLPPLSFEGPRVELAGVLEPAYEVAGDCFDYAVNGDEALVTIVDAMGHGLEASRIANLAVGAARHSRRLGFDLIETFRAVDQQVAEQFGDERFVTGQFASLDLNSGHFRFVSAGHPKPLLLRGTTVVGELPVETSMPIGLGDIPGMTADISLEPGDRIVFYTDGVVEARSPSGEEFGLERLSDMLSRAATAEEPAAEMMRRLVHSVLAHEAGRLRDDATILMLGWRVRR